MANQVASWHDDDFGGCTDQACWQGNVDGVGGAAPILLGEFGEIDCGHAYVDGFMGWADKQAGGVGIGYLAWTWDDWPGCLGPTLILDYTGTPTGYGTGVQSHFQERFPAPAAVGPRCAAPANGCRHERRPST